VVVDLEATCWGAAEHPALAADQANECEIIEIGAVDLGGPVPHPEALTGEPRIFQAHVRPRRHPVLSPFCTELTGILQEQVDRASSFPVVYRAFLEWVGGDDGLVLASWGAWDDRQLRRDAARWELPEPRWQFTNIRRLFTRQPGAARARRGGWLGLAGAVAHLGGAFTGRQHSAVDDAVNAAWVLLHLQAASGGDDPRQRR
jgi:inhibitor of KinA sporulation pathway (predicted exonuclease)